MERNLLSDFISNPLRQIRLLADVHLSANRRIPSSSGFLYPSEVATSLNADGPRKLRNPEWLISAILLDFSHLRVGSMDFPRRAFVTKSRLEPQNRRFEVFPGKSGQRERYDQ